MAALCATSLAVEGFRHAAAAASAMSLASWLRLPLSRSSSQPPTDFSAATAFSGGGGLLAGGLAGRQPLFAPACGRRALTAAAAAETDYASLTVVKLQDLLRSRGLPASGKKAQLIEKLESADKAGGTAVPAAEKKEEKAKETKKKKKEPKSVVVEEEVKKEPKSVTPKKKKEKKVEDDVPPKEEPKTESVVAKASTVEKTEDDVPPKEEPKTESVVAKASTVEKTEEAKSEDDGEDKKKEENPYGRRKWGTDDDFVGLGPGSPTWRPHGLQFFVGDMIEAKRGGELKYARVAKNHANDTYTVKWDSDAVETQVQYEELRKPRNAANVPMPAWIEDWWPED